MSEIGPEGQEFLAAMARGDEEAQKIQDLHETSTKAASGLLELAAEHYAACRVADFWRAEETAGRIAQMADCMRRAHALTVGKDRS